MCQSLAEGGRRCPDRGKPGHSAVAYSPRPVVPDDDRAVLRQYDRLFGWLTPYIKALRSAVHRQAASGDPSAWDAEVAEWGRVLNVALYDREGPEAAGKADAIVRAVKAEVRS